jgi:predicted kinase
MVGAPASGKTTLAKKIVNRYNSMYNYFSLDYQKTKMSTLLKESIDKNENIIIDNTNPSYDNREKYYQLALNYEPLVIYFNYPKELCYHLNMYRTQKNMITDKISKLVYNIYYKKLDIYDKRENILTIEPNMIIPAIKDNCFYYSYDI